jgi:hypothetical protein
METNAARTRSAKNGFDSAAFGRKDLAPRKDRAPVER